MSWGALLINSSGSNGKRSVLMSVECKSGAVDKFKSKYPYDLFIYSPPWLFSSSENCVGSISHLFFPSLTLPWLFGCPLPFLTCFLSLSLPVSFVSSVTWFLLALARELLSRGVYRSHCSLWLGGKPSYAPRCLSVRSITVRTVRLNRMSTASLSRPCGLEGAL